ncbi:AMP-dependent synthetase [Streptomyces sp. TSRI0445]|uniref:AMP-dependent synthetase/ligase n=1 Tax=Streptomyces TaxID=1883 RepID=UPI00093F1EC2|nr:AMP-dependent synthetase/ligase [Streptomyces sp. TSRI0445]OKI73172.1 AMP-dependent synthetase [Streptomyces sp. TSRI0445]
MPEPDALSSPYPLSRLPAPPTLAALADWAGARYGGRPALRFRSPDEPKGWQEVSYEQLRTLARGVARGLMGLGVAPGDRAAILAETRPEWTYAHLGVLTAGAVVVPVYPTAGDEEVVWVLGDSGATVVICEDAVQAAKVERLRDRLPGVRAVVLMSGAAEEGLALLELPGPAAESTLAVHGMPDSSTSTVPSVPSDASDPLDDLDARIASRSADDLATIVYTSGTTGPPKGCRVTHGNIAAVRDGTLDLIPSEEGDSTYLYLPLAHTMAQLVEFETLIQGTTLIYFGGRIEDVVTELAEARPTHLPSVPRLFEKVHSVVLSLAEGQEGGRERFEEAVRTGVAVAELRERGEEPDAELARSWREADERLFSLVRGAFGGRLKWALTGAAPIAPATLDFLRACGIAIFEGYGMTESGGVISLNHPAALRYGSVGRPMPGCEVRIGSPGRDGGGDGTDGAAAGGGVGPGVEGEVLTRGPHVFGGYHGDPAATAAVLDADGWLRTGDLGHLDEDGYLFITGRRKDLIITSGGKNLTPSLTEFALQQSRFVSRAVMVGDRRPHPVALITLDTDELRGWAEREGVTLGRHPAREKRVRELVQEAVDTANAQLSRPARIRAFALLDEDFDVAGGLLTPSLKVRRPAVLTRYAPEIEALYGPG